MVMKSPQNDDQIYDQEGTSWKLTLAIYLSTAAADLQHPLKGRQGGDQE